MAVKPANFGLSRALDQPGRTHEWSAAFRSGGGPQVPVGKRLRNSSPRVYQSGGATKTARQTPRPFRASGRRSRRRYPTLGRQQLARALPRPTPYLSRALPPASGFEATGRAYRRPVSLRRKHLLRSPLGLPTRCGGASVTLPLGYTKDPLLRN